MDIDMGQNVPSAVEDDDIMSSVPDMGDYLRKALQKTSEKKLRREVPIDKTVTKNTRNVSSKSIRSTISLKKEELEKNRVKLLEAQTNTQTWLTEAPVKIAEINSQFEAKKTDLLKTQDHTKKGKEILVKWHQSMIDMYTKDLRDGNYSADEYTDDFKKQYAEMLARKQEKLNKIQTGYIDFSNKIINEKINGENGYISKIEKLEREIEALEISFKEAEKVETMTTKQKDTGSTRDLVNKISDSADLDSFFNEEVDDNELMMAANDLKSSMED